MTLSIEPVITDALGAPAEGGTAGIIVMQLAADATPSVMTGPFTKTALQLMFGEESVTVDGSMITITGPFDTHDSLIAAYDMAARLLSVSLVDDPSAIIRPEDDWHPTAAMLQTGLAHVGQPGLKLRSRSEISVLN